MYAKQIKWVTGDGREAVVTVAVVEDLDRAAQPSHGYGGCAGQCDGLRC